MFTAARNARAVSPTLHHTTTIRAEDVWINPLPTMLTRMNVTAVALCISAPATSPSNAASTGVCVADLTRFLNPPLLNWRRFCPTNCNPRKNNPSPRMRLFKGVMRYILTPTARDLQEGLGQSGGFARSLLRWVASSLRFTAFT